MPEDRISIKGTSNGLLIRLGSGMWPDLLAELDQLLGERASFFKGGRVALVVGPRRLTLAQLETVGRLLDQHKVTLWAIDSEAPDTRAVAAELGLETGLAGKSNQPSPPAIETQGDSLVVRRTLRSGQVIYHPGHVVIIGDVNPGAEIRAGGSVVVWGRLRGSVHAGLDEVYGQEALVCALRLSPTQLRIGQLIARSPAEEDNQEITPETASIQDGRIVAELWKG